MITRPALQKIIANALDEDVQGGDVTSLAILGQSRPAIARFLAKETGVLAGLGVATMVFEMVDKQLVVNWSKKDGDRISKGEYFGTVEGSAYSIVVAERLALNMLQRMSGIATTARQMQDAVGPHRAKILDTRKTVPGLRLLDKLAVKLGGGTNHRVGLYDMVLIKDNHIKAAGSVQEAISRVHRFLKEQHQENMRVEVEARTLDEVRIIAASPGVHRILLDNMVVVRGAQVDTSLLQQAVALVAGRVPTEASGNVTLATVPAIAATGVDFISSGLLTHSVKALDISLKITDMGLSLSKL
eukprot:g2605.t1